MLNWQSGLGLAMIIYFMYPLSGMFSSHKGVVRALKMKWQWVSLVHGPQKVKSHDFWIQNLSTLINFIYHSFFCTWKCIQLFKIYLQIWISNLSMRWLSETLSLTISTISTNNNNNNGTSHYHSYLPANQPHSTIQHNHNDDINNDDNQTTAMTTAITSTTTIKTWKTSWTKTGPNDVSHIVWA